MIKARKKESSEEEKRMKRRRGEGWSGANFEISTDSLFLSFLKFSTLREKKEGDHRIENDLNWPSFTPVWFCDQEWPSSSLSPHEDPIISLGGGIGSSERSSTPLPLSLSCLLFASPPLFSLPL